MGLNACAGPREGMAQRDGWLPFGLCRLTGLGRRPSYKSFMHKCIHISMKYTHNIHVSVSWEGVMWFNSLLSLKDATVVFLPFCYPFPPDASWIAPRATSAHQSGRKLAQKKGKGCFLLYGQAKATQAWMCNIPEQVWGRGQGHVAGNRTGNGQNLHIHQPQ